MKSHAETKELLMCAARIARLYHEEKLKSSDGKVGKLRWLWIITKSVGDLYDAFEGITEIPAESGDFTDAELNDLYESALTELNWTPTEHTKNIAFSIFATLRDLYTNLLRLKNTLRPPRAEIVP